MNWLERVNQLRAVVLTARGRVQREGELPVAQPPTESGALLDEYNALSRRYMALRDELRRILESETGL